jgi:hypothetical protein
LVFYIGLTTLLPYPNNVYVVYRTARGLKSAGGRSGDLGDILSRVTGAKCLLRVWAPEVEHFYKFNLNFV